MDTAVNQVDVGGFISRKIAKGLQKMLLYPIIQDC